jgi:integrase
MRDGAITITRLVDLYMAYYEGRDPTRLQRLTWWQAKLGPTALQDVSDDHIHAALEALARQPARVYNGKDVDKNPIFKAKRRTLSPASINRYNASIGAVFTWAINRRIALKGWVHPCRSIERLSENNARIRFLSADERDRLMVACRASKWPKLYLLVLLALTTGARKGELLELRWGDVDYAEKVAYIGRSKNGDPRTLPLVPAAIEELQKFTGASNSLVFASTRRPAQAYSFEPCWTEALREAKIKAFRFHDLRHTCASMLAQAGSDLLAVGNVLGHRQLTMAKRYAHLTVENKAELVGRVLGGIR